MPDYKNFSPARQTSESKANEDLSRVSSWHGIGSKDPAFAAAVEMTPTGGEVVAYEPQSIWQRLAGVRVPSKIVWK